MRLIFSDSKFNFPIISDIHTHLCNNHYDKSKLHVSEPFSILLRVRNKWTNKSCGGTFKNNYFVDMSKDLLDCVFCALLLLSMSIDNRMPDQFQHIETEIGVWSIVLEPTCGMTKIILTPWKKIHKSAARFIVHDHRRTTSVTHTHTHARTHTHTHTRTHAHTHILLLAGLPGFARDHCSIIMSISTFYF